MLGLLLVVLMVIGLVIIIRPAKDGETAVRRSIWLGGTFLVLTYNLFPWYLLWLLPLVALFLSPGRLAGVRVDAWTGWWFFCGSVALSYTFFKDYRQVPLAHWGQFLPLYLFLLADLVRWLKQFPALKNALLTVTKRPVTGQPSD
jgi:hypothetical protein